MSHVYNGAHESAESLVSATLRRDPNTRDALEAAGLLPAVEKLMQHLAARAQIIALSDVIEHLQPLMSVALAGHADLADDLDGLRLSMVSSRLDDDPVE